MNQAPKTISSRNQRTNNIPQPVWDARLLSSITTDTEELPQEPQQQQIVKKKQKRIKRCHGDRKSQRFRRKCRAKGMKPAKIAKCERKKFNTATTTTTQVNTDTNKMKNNSTIAISNKRKRDLPTMNQVVKSASQLSITASPRKKMTKTTNNITTTTSISNNNMPIVIHHKIYRRAPYLKRLSRILLQALRLQLDYRLKKKAERIFVYKRLQLLDKQYCLELHRSLWQSCMTLGSQQYLWPDEIYTMFKTKDSRLCFQFVENYIHDIQQQLDQCNNKLTRQKLLCPESLSCDQIDERLKEYIQSQQKRFQRKIDHQLTKFKENIDEKQLYNTLFNGDSLTDEQKNFLQQLLKIQDNQLECWKEFLMLEQRILSKILPQNFDQLQNFMMTNFNMSLVDTDISFQYQLKQKKILQESKRIWLDIYVQAYLLKIHQYNQHYQSELTKFEQSLNSSIDNEEIRSELLKSMETYMTHRKDRLKHEIYLQMNYFHMKLIRRRRQCSSTHKHMIGVSPEVFLDVHHHDFTAIECEYLSRGGNYIQPNRTSLRPYSEREKLAQKEHDVILKKTKECISKNCRSIPFTSPLFKEYSERIQAYLKLRYMTPLPYTDQIRAKQESRIVKSIRRKLKKHKLILRESDKGGNLYIGPKNIFEEKAVDYRTKTGAYKELEENPVDDTIEKVTRLLNDLHMKTKQLSKKQYEKMFPKREKVRLAYMYFNPKTHKDPITLRPIMNTIRAVTTGISHFLDDLIRPLFEKSAQPKSIIDGSHLLRQLQQYVCDGHLTPNTLFCTTDINNLYTMLPQDESLENLEQFLKEYNLEKDLQGIPLKVILQLAEIVLKEAVFFYDNKYYRQIVGGPMGSPFTLTLANIFMWKWENQILCNKLGPNEIYCRFIDDIFFTSNETKATIERILKEANDFHSNIKLEGTISQTVSFLDLLITNNNGTLSSSVYRKPAAEPCVVPFISDHPRHVFPNVIQTALVRAVRYSSTLEIFQKEYRTIRLMLLYNGYPSKYIDTHFENFFKQYLSTSSLIPYIYDENQFLTLRNELFPQPSLKEIQTARRIAKIDEKPDENKPNKFHNTLFLHYTHEQLLEPLKRDIHNIYSDVFQGTDASNIRLIIGHRNSRNLAYELIQKKPHCSKLKPKPLPKTHDASKSNIN